MTPEHLRLSENPQPSSPWRKWGPYISERAWGTVREDYSPGGSAWEYFPHDHARSRAYRWSEDAIGGFCDNRQILCLGLALWNGKDPILKERFFGLTGNEGNHGEDVKEYYFYLDSTPTHSYCKMLYKYPQVEYPYGSLVEENRRRGKEAGEFELADAIGDAFAAGRYWDVVIEYAKAAPEDVYCRITIINRAPDPAELHLLPHLWFRNKWSWGGAETKPRLSALGAGAVKVDCPLLGEYWWYASAGTPLFTENETNFARLYGIPNRSEYVKDGINDAVVHGRAEAVNGAAGTKVAAHCRIIVAGDGGTHTLWVRLTNGEQAAPFSEAEAVFAERVREADEFFAAVQSPHLGDDARNVQRQAFAGLLWTKQFYHYDIDIWLDGDRAQPPPPASRLSGRNREWRHLNNADIISMPDKWEYPWYAAWDLAFHTLPLAQVDPKFAKQQLILMTREWYMHPNGQLPAYEWAFGDVNPPVHAWAVWRVYKIARNVTGQADVQFLERAFHKLLLNFTWWVNRKDVDGNNVFQGGFLGLDNIGVFDRSAPLPTGGRIEQADGTAWMGMYCLNMLAIALELARHNPAYEDTATKFFEHFIYIANAINRPHARGGLWDETDGFFYDALHLPGNEYHPFRLRSFVGLIPLYAVETLEPDLLEILPNFQRRMHWFIDNKPELTNVIASLTQTGEQGRRLLSLVGRDQLSRVLSRMLDPDQFLSPYGLRSISKEHEASPYVLRVAGMEHRVRYDPAESSTSVFGGNSNWRGPIWFPTNYLMIESLQKFHHYYGEDFTVPHPAGSLTLNAVADDLSGRLTRLFLRGNGRRPVFGDSALFQDDPHWRDNLLFYEYFHGDTGAGLGASHQTGWTALVAKLLK
jgi:hypothetical protein